MIVANLTLGEVIWLLFVLVLIVIGIEPIKLLYLVVALYKPPFLNVDLFKLFSI